MIRNALSEYPQHMIESGKDEEVFETAPDAFRHWAYGHDRIERFFDAVGMR